MRNEKMRFDSFSKEMANHFAEMTNGGTEPLYQINLDKEELYQVYLDAFPLEENQIFRVRRAMDCSCCKHFIRNIGAVVAIQDNKMVSIWDLDVEALDSIYKNLKKQQKTSQEESLLETVSKEDKEINNKIEIIRIIVNDKLAAKERAIKAAEKRTRNQRILEIMADKKDAALKEKSIEELQAMLATDDDTDDIDED